MLHECPISNIFLDLMAVLVKTTEPRGERALEFSLAAHATRLGCDEDWKSFTDPEGRRSFTVPSSRGRGRFYRVTADGCTCPDLKYRPWVVCKHMLAVRLQLELEEPEYAF